MLGHGGSSAGSYLDRPSFPHPLALCCHYPVSKYCSASIVVTSTVRVKAIQQQQQAAAEAALQQQQQQQAALLRYIQNTVK